MRKKKHGTERISACSDLLIDFSVLKSGDFAETFGNTNPVHLEIGCGKGNFACEMASKHPDINFIAIEKVADVCCAALEKAKCRAEERKTDNLRFFIGDANKLAEIEKKEIFECIYLNFSDPWPKKAHEKRRLTYRTYLDIYADILKRGGILKLKTDNVQLYESSAAEIGDYCLEIIFETRDLHTSEVAADNVMTEYEKNFSEKGVKINSLWARFPTGDRRKLC